MDTAYGIQWYYGILWRNTTTLQPSLGTDSIPGRAASLRNGVTRVWIPYWLLRATAAFATITEEFRGIELVSRAGFANCCKIVLAHGMKSFHETANVSFICTISF